MSISVADRAAELAVELVSIPTPGGGEDPAARWCARVLEQAGWAVELIPYAPMRTQVLAVRGQGEPRRCLCGHLDTVPAQDGEWSVDPFLGVIRDGHLWGRGASDMKGGIGAILAAAEASDGQDCAVLLTASEETGAQGADALAEHPSLAAVREWVVAEPTANAALTAHRGVLWLRLTVRRAPGHASSPPPDGGAAAVLTRALASAQSLELGGAHEELGAPSLALTVLRAGSAPNVLPGEAEAVIDLRWTPNADARVLERELRERLGSDVQVERLCCLQPVVGPRQGPLLEGLHTAGPARYFTDLSVLAGPEDSILILGPGEAAYAHAVDERCSVKLIGEAAQIYQRLLA